MCACTIIALFAIATPTKLCACAQPSYMLEELVFGYLTHSGFSETARLAARDMMGGAREVSAFDVESVKRRREISDCVAAGDIDRSDRWQWARAGCRHSAQVWVNSSTCLLLPATKQLLTTSECVVPGRSR